MGKSNFSNETVWARTVRYVISDRKPTKQVTLSW